MIPILSHCSPCRQGTAGRFKELLLRPWPAHPAVDLSEISWGFAGLGIAVDWHRLLWVYLWRVWFATNYTFIDMSLGIYCYIVWYLLFNQQTIGDSTNDTCPKGCAGYPQTLRSMLRIHQILGYSLVNWVYSLYIYIHMFLKHISKTVGTTCLLFQTASSSLAMNTPLCPTFSCIHTVADDLWWVAELPTARLGQIDRRSPLWSDTPKRCRPQGLCRSGRAPRDKNWWLRHPIDKMSI